MSIKRNLRKKILSFLRIILCIMLAVLALVAEVVPVMEEQGYTVEYQVFDNNINTLKNKLVLSGKVVDIKSSNGTALRIVTITLDFATSLLSILLCVFFV